MKMKEDEVTKIKKNFDSQMKEKDENIQRIEKDMI